MKLKHGVRKSNPSHKKNFRILIFFKRLMFGLFAVLLFLLTLYFFVFPSIISKDLTAKNILIVSNKLDVPSNYIYVAHISNDNSQNSLISIPAQQNIEVPGGYGEYPLQSIYQLLLIDQKDDQVIKATFSQILEIAIDEIIAIDQELKSIESSNLSSFFLDQFFTKLGRFDLIESKNILQLHYLTNHLSKAEIEQLSDFKSYLPDIKTISGDLYQYCSVAVINASGENGRARQKGTIIENTGALVVRIDDFWELQERSTIFYDTQPVNCKELAIRLSGILNQKPEILPIEKLEDAQKYRAKVIVVIGQ
jgi:hypothetical protein